MNKTLLRALYLSSFALVPLQNASADFTKFENFETLNLGPIDDQGPWIAQNDTSIVTLDPETGVGQVLAVTTDSTHLHRSASILDDTSRMVFLRFRFGSQQNYSFGFSASSYPDQFGEFAVELNMSNAETELRVNDDGQYEELIELNQDIWYNCWILVDNVHEEIQIWLNDRPLDGAVATDQLDSDGQTVFVFRHGHAGNIQSFFIKTGGGAGPSGPLYLDDVYIENTNQLNLTNPLDQPGVGFCFGDPGVDAPCPCGNDNDGSLTGAGCANGHYASGARLSGTGAPSVSDDTLVLHCVFSQNNQWGLYFQGEASLGGGLPWGDGLRCAGGTVRRLGTRLSDGTGYSDTSGLPFTISERGDVDPGDTRHYQLWYRNPAGSPCGFNFNTSNGYTVTWRP